MADNNTPPASRRESMGIRFKPSAPTTRTESANPALERYRMPDPPSAASRLAPALRAVAVAFAVAVVFAVILLFAPLGDPTRQADTEILARALRKASATPDQYQPVWEVREATLRVRARAEPDVLAALFAAAALGELHNGDAQKGLDQCRYTVSTYRGSAAAGLASPDSLMATCSGCKGSGKVGGASPGSLSAACPRCMGDGKELSRTAVREQYVKAISAASAAVRVGSGPGILRFLRQAQSALRRIVPKGALPAPIPADHGPATTNAPGV